MFDTKIFDGIQMEQRNEEMQTGKAKSWLGEYSWVSLPITEDTVPQELSQKAIDWCKDYFGKSGSRWFEKSGKFYFKNEKDLSLFILQFCS